MITLIIGVKFCEVVASMAITQVFVHAAQTAISMYVMYILFDNPYLGSHITTVTILMLIGMEGMLMGKLRIKNCCTTIVDVNAIQHS